MLHLGCENLQHDQFVEELGEYDHDRVKFLTCQDVEDEFAAARDIPLEKFITHTFPLEQLQQALDTALDSKSGSIKVILKP